MTRSLDAEVEALISAAGFTAEQARRYRQLAVEDERRHRMADEFLRHPSASLGLDDLQAGIQASHQNANELLSDAELLMDHKRAARCFALSYCAVEEAGKMAILHEMCELPPKNQKLWSSIWKKRFRDHKAKYALGRANLWTDMLYDHHGALLSVAALEGKVGEKLRQLGFYVEYLASDKRWGSPTEITLDMAREDLHRAQVTVQRTNYYMSRGLYSRENLERRQTICGKIYPKSGPLPESGEELSLWILRLLKVRQAFFQELVHQGILDPFYPDPKSPKTRGAI